jgi:DNA-binding response OmpR family regulator
VNSAVAIVDDSLTVRMDLADAFTAAGFEARPVATVAAARDTLAAGGVRAWILDVRLPDGDGVDLLREIRRADAEPPPIVLMLSSEADVADRVRGLRTGADEYVGKPYDAAYVVARVEELLRGQDAAGPQADGPASILVIDDSVTFREELRAALEAAGYHVWTAGTGEDGLRLAGAHRPDAIVVDGMLPGIDGATVIRRLRLDAVLRGTPCLLLTASEDRTAELAALDAGADTFLRKEEDFALILARLAAVLRRPTAHQPVGDSRSLLGPKAILAVDADAGYLHALADALKGEGCAMMLARSGEEAIELLGVQPVDCIVLGLELPGLDGRETCARIKQAPVVREVPLVLVTGRGARDATIRGLAAGADDVVPKASGLEVLRARVLAQIRRRQVETEQRRLRETLLRQELEATEARAARALAETRAALVEELQRKNRELEAFSYSVSHDLRAPLRSIDGFSRALLDDAAALPPASRDYLARIGAAAARMGELIEDLLELARVGQAEMRRGPGDLAELAREVVAELRRRDPGRTVDVVVPDALPVDGDRRLLKVVLENLLGNAWKFTGRTERPRIEIGRREAADGPVYFVADNGAGFDMGYAEKLFRPFQRLHSEREFHGTGVGLATVARIVERHGGRIWAQGVVGAGARFEFTLPPPGPAAAVVTAAAAPAPRQEAPFR